MVFVPFTAINNHKKSITVGAALLSGETLDNFKWLLEAFLKAHCGKQPSLVLTDQCLAMKQAIPLVFTQSRHRLCMWHIMAKVPNKVSILFIYELFIHNEHSYMNYCLVSILFIYELLMYNQQSYMHPLYSYILVINHYLYVTIF